MKTFGGVFCTAMLIFLNGCASKYVDASVQNNTGAAVTLVEVDYPSASFGTESLAAGAVFHYRFKILGSGRTKVLWTDAAKKEHSVAGPSLQEGEQGPLTITLGPSGATWDAQIHR
jgi:hypothetical protein